MHVVTSNSGQVPFTDAINEGSNFSAVILKPRVLVELATSSQPTELIGRVTSLPGPVISSPQKERGH